MASNTIDELQLQIGSDATEAIRQLGNLSAALNIAAESAGRLGSASSNLQKFASGIERIGNANFSRAIDNLTKLSRINLNNLRVTTRNQQAKEWQWWLMLIVFRLLNEVSHNVSLQMVYINHRDTK